MRKEAQMQKNKYSNPEAQKPCFSHFFRFNDKIHQKLIFSSKNHVFVVACSDKKCYFSAMIFKSVQISLNQKENAILKEVCANEPINFIKNTLALSLNQKVNLQSEDFKNIGKQEYYSFQIPKEAYEKIKKIYPQQNSVKALVRNVLKQIKTLYIHRQ